MTKAKKSTLVLDSFHKTAAAFIESLSQVFDDCPVIAAYQSTYKNIICKSNITKIEMIETWFNTMRPYFKDCSVKDASKLLIADVGFLKQIDFRTKYYEMAEDPESLAALWDYINKLN
ncbi:MAG: hypothetical protein H0U27_00895, partial [Nitrosopumilus sp.]|nr:hypothetical protein [Nitrosopumilus sp.]